MKSLNRNTSVLSSLKDLLLLFLFGQSLLILSAGAETKTSDPVYQNKVKPFFKQYCISCHGPDKSKGDITLHTLDAEMELVQDLKHWEKVLDVIMSGEMPPEDEKQPNAAEKKEVAKWIDDGLKAYVKKTSGYGEKPVVRRLSNFEYQNTMRDLLGVDMDFTRDLPEDPDKPYHFNNTSFYMMLGMEQIDQYEKTARRALSSVIVEGPKPEVYKQKSQTWSTQRPGEKPAADSKKDQEQGKGKDKKQKKSGGKSKSPLAPAELAFVTGLSPYGVKTVKDGFAIKRFPQTGEFRLRFKLSAKFTEQYHELPFRIIMGYVQTYDRQEAPYKAVFSTVLTKKENSQPKVFEVIGRIEDIPSPPPRKEKKVKKSTGEIVGERVISPNIMLYPQNLFDDGTLCDKPSYLSKPLAVFEWVEFEAPVVDVWPPRSHRQIFFDSDQKTSNPDAYIKEVLSRFMTRAFRRPVKSHEVNEYFDIYKIALKNFPTMEKAMIETLTMVLISPDFLYHTNPGMADEYYQYHLASKLSYFLWGTMPDNILNDAARKNQLQDNSIIASQVKRMLADNRSRQFVDNFTRQWLSIDKSKTVPINFNLFPRFGYRSGFRERSKTFEKTCYVSVRDDMIEETVSFVGELIKRNSNVLGIIDSDFAMLNARLAHHYGVKGVNHVELKPVNIKPDHHLGGLLTQGSVLIGNGTGSAPHPIYRAVWLREAILGDEVKDPPADVPALVDSVGKEAETSNSIKKLLEIHRRKESCNDCHVRLDPWGIPFEEYNAIGQYQPLVPKDGVTVEPLVKQAAKKNEEPVKRSMEEYQQYLKSIYTEKVEADARVPHGPNVNGMLELKKHLIKDRKDDIAENVLRRLLSYSLGKKLTYHDRYKVETLFKESKQNNHRLQDMIISICQSGLFLGKEDKK